MFKYNPNLSAAFIQYRHNLLDKRVSFPLPSSVSPETFQYMNR
jgi:hypothetical protein